jgi:hypothetical protein
MPGASPTLFQFRTPGLEPSSVEVEDTASALRLERIHPNPFSGPFEIRFTLDEPGPVRLTMQDVSGRTVATLLEETRNAGSHVVSIDPAGSRSDDVPAGVYFVRLESNGSHSAQRVVKLAR